MANQIHKPERIEPVGLDHSEYLIYSRLEIVAILRTLQKTGSMVTAYFGGNNDFILTSIVAVRPEQGDVVIDYGADAAANERALQAGNLTFVAAHERIKIQFVAESVRHVDFEHRDALSMPIPATLLRLQRRQYFRIAIPLTRPLLCFIGPQAKPVPVPAQVSIFDISCGGIAVFDASGPANFETGQRLRGCRIALPELGEVTTDILVKSIFEVTHRNGAKQKRAGCEFVKMPERNRALIQRYINHLERERKSRTRIE